MRPVRAPWRASSSPDGTRGTPKRPAPPKLTLLRGRRSLAILGMVGLLGSVFMPGATACAAQADEPLERIALPRLRLPDLRRSGVRLRRASGRRPRRGCEAGRSAPRRAPPGAPRSRSATLGARAGSVGSGRSYSPAAGGSATANRKATGGSGPAGAPIEIGLSFAQAAALNRESTGPLPASRQRAAPHPSRGPSAPTSSRSSSMSAWGGASHCVLLCTDLRVVYAEAGTKDGVRMLVVFPHGALDVQSKLMKLTPELYVGPPAVLIWPRLAGDDDVMDIGVRRVMGEPSPQLRKLIERLYGGRRPGIELVAPYLPAGPAPPPASAVRRLVPTRAAITTAGGTAPRGPRTPPTPASRSTTPSEEETLSPGEHRLPSGAAMGPGWAWFAGGGWVVVIPAPGCCRGLRRLGAGAWVGRVPWGRRSRWCRRGG